MKVISVNYDILPSSFPAHSHDTHQIIYVKKGGVNMVISGREYKAEKGCLIIISKFEHHSLESIDREYERYSVNISSASVSDENILLSSVLVNRPENFCHVINTGENSHLFEACFESLHREADEKAPLYQEILSLRLREILTLVYRIAPHIFSKDTPSLIPKVQKYIEENFRKDINLSSLAELFHVSRFHLSRLFKKTVGYSPIDYLINCRLSAAKDMLRTTNLSIKEIVYTCGFTDESNFSRMFRLKTGVTPTFYKQMKNFD